MMINGLQAKKESLNGSDDRWESSSERYRCVCKGRKVEAGGFVGGEENVLMFVGVQMPSGTYSGLCLWLFLGWGKTETHVRLMNYALRD